MTFFYINGPTGPAFSSGPLLPSSTDFVLPAGTLAPGTTYQMELGFGNTSAITNTGGVFAYDNFGPVTFLTFTTAAASTPTGVPEPPTFPLLVTALVMLCVVHRAKLMPQQ